MQPTHQPGDTVQIQFVWRLPDDDYLRAVFQAEIIAVQSFADRYLLQLTRLQGGLQEAQDGKPRPADEMNANEWARVVGLIGKQVRLAYEATDGRPLYMRYETLSGAHNFFHRANGDA